MTTLPQTTHVLSELDGGWLTIWLNQPKTRNALSGELSEELRLLLEAVHDDRSVRGITLRGKGGVFCAGGDIKNFKSGMQADSSTMDDVVASSRSGGELFGMINTMPQPVIILVDGAAIGGGMGVVCTGDIVIATRDSKFGLGETRLGLPPAQITPFVVQRLGLSIARRMMLTGARFDGERACEIGLVDFVATDVADAERLEAEVRTSVLHCAPGANAITKELALAAGQLGREQMLQKAGEAFAQCMLSDEGREGVAAFLEKRRPHWAPEK